MHGAGEAQLSQLLMAQLLKVNVIRASVWPGEP